ncbi:CD63 antigen-like isoform X2 [Anneissia japonica]|uniref:CD63 antigen-like isoform X2 n=1 Tax=Anneissia japonica TaxID=1529436 RepID=UPI001425AA8E|nr:CD63 antigen-like isoform X2 [Anneissia japonica]
MAEGGMKIVKCMLFFFNAIFWICGLALIIGGVLVLRNYNEYVKFTGDLGDTIPILIIVVGGIIFITGFCGCCGAIKESYCMVSTYACILIVLLVAEVGIGIAGFVMNDEVKDQITENMDATMKDYQTVNVTRDLWNDMQKNLKCCGTYNYTDWYDVIGDKKVPASCCIEKGCEVNQTPKNVYEEGCSEALFNFIKENIIIIAGIAIGVAVIQIIGVVCACCLMKSIKNEYEVV